VRSHQARPGILLNIVKHSAESSTSRVPEGGPTIITSAPPPQASKTPPQSLSTKGVPRSVPLLMPRSESG
jgi:hypothetical protein